MNTDYLVIGCGASSMAFVDVMLSESNATFTIVDRRDAPGGHWNDAYPYVRLHQPSSYYGVASRPLGQDRIDSTGFNAGFYELASGTEVLSYYHGLMDQDFLPSGRVTYIPMSEYHEDGMITSLISGTKTPVEVRRKLVDGSRIGTQIPLTHRRSFDISQGVDCIAPNDLTRRAPEHSGFVILGAGKTAMDAVIWLLGRGADPNTITWVRPRDCWMINRAQTQPGIEFFDDSIGGFARQLEILGSASDAKEIAAQMESAGLWLRIDTDCEPEIFHAAVISEGELAQLRRVKNVIRQGHVHRIERDRIVMERADMAVEPDQLYIDCTASAAAANINDRDPVFSPDRINLQMIRPHQPTFSAALIGCIEAKITDEKTKQAASRVTPMMDTVEDWIERRLNGTVNQIAWNENEILSEWIAGCRLDIASKAIPDIDREDAEKMKIFARLREATPKAIENMMLLVSKMKTA